MENLIENLDIERINWEYEVPVKNSYRKICDYEESVLSCLLQNPELMKELIVNENDFYKYERIFRYFKLFYETFNCLDLTLMVNKIKKGDRHLLVEVYDKLIDFEPTTSCFKFYQEGLIEYNKEHREELLEKEMKREILELALKLAHEEIGVNDFFEKLENRKKE